MYLVGASCPIWRSNRPYEHHCAPGMCAVSKAPKSRSSMTQRYSPASRRVLRASGVMNVTSGSNGVLLVRQAYGLELGPCSLPCLATLPPGLKQDNRGRLRHVQGIDLPCHGDADGERTVPRGAYTGVLCPQDQDAGEAQIDLGIELTGARSRGQQLQRVVAQPVLGLH